MQIDGKWPAIEVGEENKRNSECSEWRKVHSFIHAMSIAPLQVRYYSEAFPTQHGYIYTVPEFHAEAHSPQATTS